MKKQCVVIGLGRFGTSVCLELSRLGHDLLVIDHKEERVNAMREYAAHGATANATDENALRSLGVRNFEQAVVAIGDDIHASVLCTLLLKEIGVERVWVKARDPQHRRILERIGADRVIQPEYDMGIRIAQNLDSEKIIDYIEISEDYSIVELVATKKVDNRTLSQLNVRAKYHCMILAIKRGQEVNLAPKPEDKVQKNDMLVVMGHRKDLKRFEDRGL
ncbi:potassium channel family protein [Planococcus lenghuensis]|uniref:Potassium transporter Trk n=1 Tax=Planococcus lenghuensis TaxID=2213202 RepID=A0A1Q2KZK7_9BACL|nr:TrkA family potassium uptake protein [Planococcus lenghuensis]AQQ53586.1 potassium transporter Trk [Planococcus lenghuensis]